MTSTIFDTLDREPIFGFLLFGLVFVCLVSNEVERRIHAEEREP